MIFLLTLFLPANLVSSCSSTGDSGGELFTSMSDIPLAHLLMKVMLLYYDIEAKILSEFNLSIACPRRTVGGRWRPWRKTIKWKIEIALVRRDWLLGTLRGHYVLLDVNCNPFTP